MKIIEGRLKGDGLSVSIIAARFNSFITEQLIEGALDGLKRHGVEEDNIKIIKVPGSFEIPVVAKKEANIGGSDAIICLGTVIRGSTPHFEYVSAEVSKGIAAVSMESPIPVIFGVLTTDTIEQAIERAGTKMGNKGYEAAAAAIEMANLFRDMA